MSAVAKHESEVLPSLPQLAQLANEEHDFFLEAGRGLVRHAIACGDALIKAQAQIPRGQWLVWLAENCTDIKYRSAYRYMRIAQYRHLIEEQGIESITAAMSMLKTSGVRRQNAQVLPWIKSTPEVVAEARRLYASGNYTQAQVGEIFGVTQMTISHWTNDEAREKRLGYHRAYKIRNREARKALKRQERDQAAKRAGGGVSEVYSQIRRLAQALDALGRDGSSVEMRAAANDAIRHIHRAEDAIVKALGLS